MDTDPSLSHILTPAVGVGVGLVKASTLKQWSLKPNKEKINEIGFFNTQYTNKSCHRKCSKFKHSLQISSRQTIQKCFLFLNIFYSQHMNHIKQQAVPIH